MKKYEELKNIIKMGNVSNFINNFDKVSFMLGRKVCSFVAIKGNNEFFNFNSVNYLSWSKRREMVRILFNEYYPPGNIEHE